MRVALLSCGPSVIQYRDTNTFDAVIGVNRVVTSYTCGYWVFGDVETYLATQPLGSPVTVTDDAQAYTLRGSGVDLGKWIRWEELSNPLPIDQVICYSAC